MKIFLKTLLFSILLFIGQRIQAQNYIPLPDSAGKWINHYYLYSPWTGNILQEYYIKFCSDGSDTLINTNQYFKIKNCIENEYYGAIRNANGKVFFMVKDSTQEYLLYDFSANVGDTIHNIIQWQAYYPNPYYFLNDAVIAYIDTTDVGDGYQRKTLHMNSGGQWIEGIGSSWGLFAENWINVSNYVLNLYCFSKRDTSYFPIFTNNTCLLNVGENNKYQFQNMTAFPNPATNSFNLPIDGKVEFAQVYNYSGNLINIDFEVLQNNIVFNTSNLVNGIYLIRYSVNHRIYEVKMVKQ